MKQIESVNQPVLHRSYAWTVWLVCVALVTSVLTVEARGDTITFTSEDYAFIGPEQISAGWHTVRLINHGREIHQIQFLGLPPGKTIGDVKQALAGRSPVLPAWLRRHGGVNSVTSGGEGTVVVNLDPGEYVLLCGIPDDTGRPHAMRGMVTSLRVSKSALSADLHPQSDTTVHLKDFYFSVTSSLTPGDHILRLLNEGTQAHELIVIRLARGASTQDFLTNYRPGSSPNSAGIEVGGLTGIDPGYEAYVHLDLQSGRYGFICFLADPITLNPHFADGMWFDLEVTPLSVPSERP